MVKNNKSRFGATENNYDNNSKRKWDIEKKAKDLYKKACFANYSKFKFLKNQNFQKLKYFQKIKNF